MRIWHQDLIPYLCSQHLVATWREALGAYSIITQGKLGYRHHPAVQEFIDCPEALHDRLLTIKLEAIKRGYHFKDVPKRIEFGGQVHPWQTLAEQTAVLQSKKCACFS